MGWMTLRHLQKFRTKMKMVISTLLRQLATQRQPKKTNLTPRQGINHSNLKSFFHSPTFQLFIVSVLQIVLLFSSIACLKLHSLAICTLTSRFFCDDCNIILFSV